MSSIFDTYTETSSREIVAGNIRARVARLGLRQQDLADALGIRQASVSLKWNGKRPWTLDDLDAIAALLRAETWELVRPAEYMRNGGHMAAVPDRYTARDSNPEPAVLESRGAEIAEIVPISRALELRSLA